ncbi:MAG TPA: IS200/IS605 family transposase [Gemmatimonadales bacterium]|nr:IS200/IS605 family transposase [Gemmatimonadales bacterium]
MSAYQIYYHVNWCTLERRPMIDAAARDFLEAYLRRVAARERVEVLALGILRTHLHVVIRTGPRCDLARLVQYWKGGSSHSIGRLPGNLLGLRWSAEYAVSTVSPASLNRAIRYVKTQELRHPDEAITARSDRSAFRIGTTRASRPASWSRSP